MQINEVDDIGRFAKSKFIAKDHTVAVFAPFQLHIMQARLDGKRIREPNAEAEESSKGSQGIPLLIAQALHARAVKLTRKAHESYTRNIDALGVAV